MTVTATICDATGRWRGAVDALDHAGLAHAPEWRTVISSVYGHTPLYLASEDDNGRVAFLPAFIVRRPVLGTVVTSMPFLDSGGPCGASAAVAGALVERLVADARRIGAGSVELRCARRLDLAVPPAEHKVNMTLLLDGGPDRVWRSLDKSVRNQIRKAERSGLSVETGGVELLPSFYDAFLARMRDLGSPVHAIGFLRAVLEAFGARARVLVVRKGDTTIGGLFALRFRDRVVVPWAASVKQYLSLCPNMLVYWEAIRTACTEGVRTFDFGRSTRGSGTYRFKRQWGATEEPLYWYTIRLSGARPMPAAVPTQSAAAPWLTAAWQHLPLPVTRFLGPRIRRYLIQ